MDQDEHAGRLPFRLWIGVTGHRELPADLMLVERVREVLNRIRHALPASDATPVRLGVVSSLAEGADRLVAREVLAFEGALLEAPLPLPRDDYLRDFASQRSREEFAELLGRASFVTVVPDMGVPEETYAEAGRLVVDRCDALVAVWDGAPSRGVGGTADAVAHARDLRVPLYWIRTGDAGYEIVEEPGNGFPVSRFRQVDAYNRAPVPPGDLTARVDAETGRLRAEGERAGLAADLVEPALAWYLPFLARADALSLGLQRRYYRLGMALFFLAALAAVAGWATSALEWRGRPVYLKVVLLLVLTVLSVGSRRRELPARWISCRLLAEQLRAAMFLTVAGLEASKDRADLVDPSLSWVQAASTEVCLRSPRGAPPAAAAAAGGLRRFLLDAWVDQQLGYLRRTGQRQRRWDGRLNTAVSWLFGVTLALTMAEAFQGQRGQKPGVALTLALTGLPALAAAFSGIREQRQYVRNSERSLRVAGRLQRLRTRLVAARDLGSVQELAAATAVLLSEENQDWFGVMGAGNLKPAP
jgi:hypothetical protein